MILKICRVCGDAFETETIHNRVWCSSRCASEASHIRKNTKDNPDLHFIDPPKVIIRYDASTSELDRWAEYVAKELTDGLPVMWISKKLPLPKWETNLNIVVLQPDEDTLIMYHPADYEYHLYVQAHTEPEPPCN